jgi:CO/xanthine dehydrogenase FAD-binding subunit
MLPYTFEYLKPADLADTLDVLEQLKDKKVEVLAGGTDLIPALRAGAKKPDYLVDLAGKGLDEVVFESDQVRMGALVTFTTLCEDPQIRRRLPAIAEAAIEVGAVQCRNLATIGGNICNAVPALDSGPPLLALGASFRLQCKGRERIVRSEEFFLGPRLTVLQPGEILTEIIVPLQERFRANFLRFGRRKALTLSIVSVAAGVTTNGKREIIDVRISLGAVAPTPMRAYKAEQLLQGRTASAELLEEAAAVAASETRPISDLRASAEYRRRLSALLVGRALEHVLVH